MNTERAVYSTRHQRNLLKGYRVSRNYICVHVCLPSTGDDGAGNAVRRKGSQLLTHSLIIKTSPTKATLPVHVACPIGGYVLLNGSQITKPTKEKRRNYRGADKSLAPPTSRCILFDGENISFDAILLYI